MCIERRSSGKVYTLYMVAFLQKGEQNEIRPEKKFQNKSTQKRV